MDRHALPRGFVAGATLAAATLVPAAIVSARRFRAWQRSIDGRLATADAMLRIVSTIDDYLFTHEHCADGTRRSVFRGPNREKLTGGPLPPGLDAATEWERMIHPDDLPDHLAHRERLRSGVPSEVRYRLVGYDGIVRWIHTRTKPSHVDGRVFVDGIVSDITRDVLREQELAETQAELRRLADLNAHQAMHDSLTGLANRRRLLAALDEQLDAESTAPQVLVLFDLNGFKQYNDAFGHPAGDALLQRLATKLLAAVPGGEAFRLGGDEFCVLHPLRPDLDIETWLEYLANTLAETGEGFDVTTAFGAVFLPDEAKTSATALHLADQRLYAEKRRRHALRGRPQELLLRALYEREPDLYEHTREVAVLTVAIAQALGLHATVVERAEQAAYMHDIGKIAIPDAILAKPGPLADAEWDLIRQHTLIGERIVAAAPALVTVAPIVRSTHERWDGTGYPDGLAGEGIPIEARIIAVCDAFSAMTHGRPYGAPRPPDVALSEVVRCAGAQFDPAVVDALVAIDRAGIVADGATRPSAA